MNTMTLSRVLDSCTLIYVEVGENSNKVWRGSLFNDGTFLAEWGRVGNALQSKLHCLGSIALAQSKFERTKRQKIRKGYSEAQLVDSKNSTLNNALSQEDLEIIAAKQIEYGRDPRSKELIRYLVKSNIHQITSQTDITYNSATGNFKTPLGNVTLQAISAARQYLVQIVATRQGNKYKLRQLLSKYLRLIPQSLGHKIDESQFASPQEIQRQYEILNALEAAIATDRPSKNIFECAIARVPGSTSEGKRTFREIDRLYKSTINQNHISAKYRLRRVYEIELPTMSKSFAIKAKVIGNVKQHWHGTKASNLLSIFKQGLIIPPANAVQCTGRMFGNGIYGSEQSTKALNYATNYWNATGEKEDRVFMLLCDFAMGKEYRPKSYGRNFPVPGYDSTYVEPGVASTINQESIVYHTDQVNIKYLCEFS